MLINWQCCYSEKARNVIIKVQYFKTRSLNPKNQMDTIYESKLITDA